MRLLHFKHSTPIAGCCLALAHFDPAIPSAQSIQHPWLDLANIRRAMECSRFIKLNDRWQRDRIDCCYSRFSRSPVSPGRGLLSSAPTLLIDQGRSNCCKGASAPCRCLQLWFAALSKCLIVFGTSRRGAACASEPLNQFRRLWLY